MNWVCLFVCFQRCNSRKYSPTHVKWLNIIMIYYGIFSNVNECSAFWFVYRTNKKSPLTLWSIGINRFPCILNTLKLIYITEVYHKFLTLEYYGYRTYCLFIETHKIFICTRKSVVIE